MTPAELEAVLILEKIKLNQMCGLEDCKSELWCRLVAGLIVLMT